MRGRTVAAIGVVVAVVGGAAVALADPTRRRLVERWVRLGAVSARSAARAAVGGEGAALRSAEDVARTLGGMKGAFMKAGQMFSYISDGLPEEARVALAQLQDSAPPMAPELAASVVRAELGDAPERIFRRWSPEPIAAASIGQVHRATLDDGTEVAVKVQYPDVAELVAADLSQLELGRFVMPSLWPNLDPVAIAAELRERLTEELDYRIEAANQRDFARWYDGHPFARVPRVVDELSTGRVLTTTFAAGDRFAALEAASQEARDAAAESIFRFVFRSLHDHLAFNGDPHPGNYLVGPGTGEVTFLDFGMVKRLTPALRDGFVGVVASAALDPDPVELRAVSEALGFFVEGSPVSDEVMVGFSQTLWSHLVPDEPTTLTPAWAADTVRTYFLKGADYKDIDRWGGLPRDAIILQRITVGLLAVLGRLHATANWHRIARELWLGEAPATPMGEAEAAWLASRPPSPP